MLDDLDSLRFVAAATLKARPRQLRRMDRVQPCGFVKTLTLNPAGLPEFPDRTLEISIYATSRGFGLQDPPFKTFQLNKNAALIYN